MIRIWKFAVQERARGCSDGALVLSMRQVGNDRPDPGRRGDAGANRGLGAIPPSPRALRSVVISHIAPDQAIHAVASTEPRFHPERDARGFVFFLSGAR